MSDDMLRCGCGHIAAHHYPFGRHWCYVEDCPCEGYAGIAPNWPEVARDLQKWDTDATGRADGDDQEERAGSASGANSAIPLGDQWPPDELVEAAVQAVSSFVDQGCNAAAYDAARAVLAVVAPEIARRDKEIRILNARDDILSGRAKDQDEEIERIIAERDAAIARANDYAKTIISYREDGAQHAIRKELAAAIARAERAEQQRAEAYADANRMESRLHHAAANARWAENELNRVPVVPDDAEEQVDRVINDATQGQLFFPQRYEIREGVLSLFCSWRVSAAVPDSGETDERVEVLRGTCFRCDGPREAGSPICERCAAPASPVSAPPQDGEPRKDVTCEAHQVTIVVDESTQTLALGSSMTQRSMIIHGSAARSLEELAVNILRSVPRRTAPVQGLDRRPGDTDDTDGGE